MLDIEELIDNTKSVIGANPLYLSSDTKPKTIHYSYDSSFSDVYSPPPPIEFKSKLLASLQNKT